MQYLSDIEAIQFDFAKQLKDLRELRMGYSGEDVSVRPTLIARKVIDIWPVIGRACVCPVVDFVSEEIRHDLLDPSRCVLPGAEWLEMTLSAIVYAEPQEWYSIDEAGFQCNMMAPVPYETN